MVELMLELALVSLLVGVFLAPCVYHNKYQDLTVIDLYRAD